jgi:hypothetical protein
MCRARVVLMENRAVSADEKKPDSIRSTNNNIRWLSIIRGLPHLCEGQPVEGGPDQRFDKKKKNGCDERGPGAGRPGRVEKGRPTLMPSY